MGHKSEKTLKQIRTETENDHEIVQMRCEPTRGTHALLRVITTGSLKEKDSAMNTVYIAMLRANEVRWNTQNAILDKAYAKRRILTSKNVNTVYRRSHQMIPTNNVAQQVGKESENKQAPNTPTKRDECPICGNKRPTIQLACKRCKLCIECTSHTICKSEKPDYIESLPK